VTLERLSNERWGFSSNCFVCEPTHPRARLASKLLASPPEFAASAALRRLTHLPPRGPSSGAGLRQTQRLAVTATFRSEFHHPIRIGKRYRLEAAIGERSESTLEATARIVDDQGRVRTSAAATMVVLSAAQAVDAGAPTDVSTQGFVRP